jgi:hypothetical protein
VGGNSCAGSCVRLREEPSLRPAFYRSSYRIRDRHGTDPARVGGRGPVDARWAPLPLEFAAESARPRCSGSRKGLYACYLSRAFSEVLNGFRGESGLTAGRVGFAAVVRPAHGGPGAGGSCRDRGLLWGSGGFRRRTAGVHLSELGSGSGCG